MIGRATQSEKWNAEATVDLNPLICNDMPFGDELDTIVLVQSISNGASRPPTAGLKLYILLVCVGGRPFCSDLNMLRWQCVIGNIDTNRFLFAQVESQQIGSERIKIEYIF